MYKVKEAPPLVYSLSTELADLLRRITTYFRSLSHIILFCHNKLLFHWQHNPSKHTLDKFHLVGEKLVIHRKHNIISCMALFTPIIKAEQIFNG